MTSGHTPSEPALASVVITVKCGAEMPAFRHRLAAHPAITPGDAHAGYLPAVLEAPSLRKIHRWLEAQPEVAQVEVIFISLAEAATPSPELAHA